MNKKMLLGGVVAVSAVLLIILSLSMDPKESVASVNGEDIEKEELYDALVEQYGQETLDTLITNKIVELETEENDITVSQEAVEEELDVYYDQYGGEEAFQSTLEASGMTIAEVEKDIEDYLAVDLLLAERISITDEEKETYFEENKESYNVPEQVSARHILTETEEEAEEVLTKLEDGEAFEDLVAEYSIDDTTVASGGDLGAFSEGEMVEAFEEAAFSMEVGEVSDIVETEYGYHIIEVTDHTEAQDAVYDEVEKEIGETLYQSKVSEEYNLWMQEKMEEYDIENTLE
ncbi:peptidylprolyl isomerase [Halobacillus kuroshimensis]|uniref:Peptidylprolyl isomerase n=1 Tax=Halobacillus kuroshimensis TaxID=302481 RepID=A0ABS3DVL4_9BACI|nr:peptidylprolyl isomerase [Halobacillus kuroshimensis]MBN8235345.1 peptidylprolyl isomerase [Halobacillus kuroshimensis]